MVPGTPNSGLVVRVQDLYTPESPFIVPNQSLRVVGSVERFDVVSGIAILTDGESSLRLDLQHLRELPLRIGSLFEFVGELEINPLHQHLTLKARVGRNVDGRDMRIFDKVVQLRRRFEKEFKTH